MRGNGFGWAFPEEMVIQNKKINSDKYFTLHFFYRGIYLNNQGRENSNFNPMKRIVFFLFCFLVISFVSTAQMAFVNTKYILTRMPDYPDSLAKLNNLTAFWQKEIDDNRPSLKKCTRILKRTNPC